jgi:hypothetical protein
MNACPHLPPVCRLGYPSARRRTVLWSSPRTLQDENTSSPDRKAEFLILGGQSGRCRPTIRRYRIRVPIRVARRADGNSDVGNSFHSASRQSFSGFGWAPCRRDPRTPPCFMSQYFASGSGTCRGGTRRALPGSAAPAALHGRRLPGMPVPRTIRRHGESEWAT